MDNSLNNYENGENGENGEDDGLSIIVIIVIVLFLFGGLVGLFFAVRKSRERASAGQGDGSPTGSPAHGARFTTPAPSQALAVVPPDQAGGKPTLNQVMAILKDLLVGVAAGEAAELIVKGIYNRLSAPIKTLMKQEFRTKAIHNLRPKNASRAIQSSWKKLMNFKFSNLSEFARTRFGLMWAAKMAARGESEATILAKLTARYGAERGAQLATRASANAAAKVSERLTAQAATTGPLTVLELAVTGIGMALDIQDSMGYMSIESRKTSDLLVQRKTSEAVQKNSYIQGPPKDDGTPDASQAIGYYPAYWGPLDEMNATPDADGLDYVDILIETKMFEMLFADEPDPFMLKLLANLARRYDVAASDIQGALDATMLTDMTQDDYWGLYDRAFASVCTSNGGALVDPGGGRPKQCSHTTEQTCHAASPWVEHVGPTVAPDVDYTYAEWRNADFFNQNYQPAVLPAGATGACIVQDPSIHQMCDSEQICTSSGCAYNEYIRNMGVCQNTHDMCHYSGVSTCEHMRKIGGSGDACATGTGGSSADLGPASDILPGNTTLRSCYVGTDQYWAEMLLPIGSSIYRWFASGGAQANATALAGALASTATQVAVYSAGTQGAVLQTALTGGTYDPYGTLAAELSLCPFGYVRDSSGTCVAGFGSMPTTNVNVLTAAQQAAADAARASSDAEAAAVAAAIAGRATSGAHGIVIPLEPYTNQCRLPGSTWNFTPEFTQCYDCDPGYTWQNSTKTCVVAPPPPPPSCPSGATYINNSCRCTGKTLGIVNNQCIACAGQGKASRDGLCVDPPSTPVIANAMVWLPNSDGTCAGGWTKTPGGECMVCNFGYKLNSTNDGCVVDAAAAANACVIS